MHLNYRNECEWLVGNRIDKYKQQSLLRCCVRLCTAILRNRKMLMMSNDCRLIYLITIFMANFTLAAINFNEHTIQSYGGDQDGTGSTVVENGGAALHLTGNVWKCIQYPYTITNNTVLEFDFQSSVQAEEHAIGMDEDLTIQQGNRFKLYGTQSDSGTSIIIDYKNYAIDAPKTRHYVIPIGQYYTGTMQYLFFSNDHDVVSPTGESVYSNVVLSEGENPPSVVTNPQPSHVATDVSFFPSLNLGWTAGSGADSHDVYFGTNPSPSSSEFVGNQTATVFSPSSLAWNTTYYWRIDAVNQYGTTNGPVWSFTTAESLVGIIDDFDYELNDPGLIAHWSDGNVNSTGSSISQYLAFYMNVAFDNTQLPYYSEVQYTFDSVQDWDVTDVDLSFWYLGDSNADEIYVRLSDSSATSNTFRISDSVVTQSADWIQVRIPLNSFTGLDLARITEIALGIGPESPSGPGGSGAVRFDEIRIVEHQCESGLSHLDLNSDCTVDMGDVMALAEHWLLQEQTVTASLPNDGQLLIHYAFDETGSTANVSDSSGNRNNATVESAGYDPTPNWQSDGFDGSGCICFDSQFWVKIPQTAFTGIDKEITISFWHYADSDEWPQFLTPFEFTTSFSGMDDSLNWEPARPQAVSIRWNHYAFVKNSVTGRMWIYENGVLMTEAINAFGSMEDMDLSSCRIGVGADGQSSKYLGKMDDFRVYSYALTQSEIVYLAGGGTFVVQPLVPLEIPADPQPNGRIDLGDFVAIAFEWLSEL